MITKRRLFWTYIAGIAIGLYGGVIIGAVLWWRR